MPSVLPSTCSIATVNLPIFDENAYGMLQVVQSPTGNLQYYCSLTSSISSFPLTLIHFAGNGGSIYYTLPECGAPLFGGMDIIDNTSNIVQSIH